MKNVLNISRRKTQNAHFIFSNFFFENRAVYEKMWKNIVEWGRPQMTIWRLRIACWIPKATNTHSEYVIPFAFPLQLWLHEGASMLRYMYEGKSISKLQIAIEKKRTGITTYKQHLIFNVISIQI